MGICFMVCGTVRGAHLGDLAVMTDPFVPQVGYSALKPIIKHQTLSLKVSNAGGLEQATACISLLTLYSTITKQQHRCLVWMAAAQWHETIHVFEHFKLILRRTHVFLNFRLWQCQLQCKQNCKSWYTATHTQELFCNISLRGERTQCPIAIVSFCSFGLNFICCLHLPGSH